MAELYLRQGHREQALVIFRRLFAQHPDDPELRQRMVELGEAVDPPGGAMSFRDSLQNMVDSVPGAMSAMIMGFDGIAIESYERESGGFDLPTLLIEYSSATQQLRQAAQQTPHIGNLTELAVSREGGTCLLRPLSEEYFLAVVLGPQAVVGKARFLMRMLAPRLTSELT